MKYGHFFFGLLAITSFSSKGAEWGLTPLGERIEPAGEANPIATREIATHYVARQKEGTALTLVEDGTSKCVVVLPDGATGTERAAAKLLQETFRKMSGAQLPIMSEGQVSVREVSGQKVAYDREGQSWPTVIWVGETLHAKEKEVSSGERPEGFRILAEEGECFLLGNDTSPYTPPRPVNGTLFAASSLLEKQFGVRWLWPGDLGEVIPVRKTIVLPPMDVQDEPALSQRVIRNISAADSVMTSLANPFRILKTDAAKYRSILEQNGRWLSLLKTGYSEYQNCAHAFEGWYAEYGNEHPEWFALQPDGTRFQFPTRERFCLSNPEVAQEVARRVLKQYEGVSSIPGGVSITPNDGSGKNFFCMCENCRKLDPPNGRMFSFMFARGKERSPADRFFESYPSLSDRFAGFFDQVAEEVAKTKPDAHLVALAYHVYSDAPLSRKKLHPSLTIGFVAGNYLSEKMADDTRRQWKLWSERTPNLFYRPNLLHVGMGMPFIYARQMGEDLKTFYREGLMAADYDSLIGHWASQGLNYYVLAKMLWDPSLDPQAVIKDYCRSGFGEAADVIESYFVALEESTHNFARAFDKWEEGKQRLELQKEEWTGEGEPPSSNFEPFSKALCEVYTPQRVSQLRAMLEQARRLSSRDKIVLQRIDFLARGLDHLEARLPIESMLANGVPLRGAETMKTRQQLADWYGSAFEESPLAINAVECVRRNYSYLQNTK